MIQQIFSTKLDQNNMKINTTLDYVILCDSSSQLEEINQIIDKYNPKIITFDIDSHNFFLKKNIEHELSDNYLNDKDLDYIQDLSYQFSKWYAESEISPLIEYEEINVGELFYAEFTHFLNPILKKVFEITKICQKFNNTFFFSSTSIISILELFSSNIEILNDKVGKQSQINKNTHLLKFGKITLTINTEKIYFKNFVKVLYKTFNKIFLRQKITFTTPSILLVNITTLYFQKFFEELPNHSINLIKFDTTIPAFWNFKSLFLIKKSRCYIENNETIYDKINSKSLKNYRLIIDQKINDLSKQEQFFKNFFSINDHTFWNIIKNDFIQMFTRNYDDAIHNIDSIKLLLKKYSFSYILLFSESNHLDLIIIKLAKKFGIKTGILQHGLYYDDLQNLNYYNFKSDQFHRVLPTHSDNFFVWGKLMQIHSEKHGIPNKKIVPTGCPFFDIHFDKTKNNKVLKSEYILLAITPRTSYNLIKELSVTTQIEYDDTLKQICEITTKMNKKLLIKVHHGTDFHEKEMIKKINPNILIKNTGNFYKYAEKCEVLICVDMSTAILEAMLLKKPVILVLINDKDSYPELFENDYLIKTKISDLQNVLTKLIHNNMYKKSVIENGEKFLNYYLTNLGTSSKALLNFFDNINNEKN
jgi:hypothetical protein